MIRQERHYINRSNWLRAAVLGANDGILSTTSIAIGVAAASVTREPVLLATLAGIVAGAMSMATGEYVSVSSQVDVERADLAREKLELETMPAEELEELSLIYQQRGLSPDLAHEVAREFMAKDALKAHARDELGINELTSPKPFQAAIASALSFLSGGALPLLVSLFAPIKHMVYFQYGFAIIFLALSGFVAALLGRTGLWKSIGRICIWGTISMGMAAIVGHLFGVYAG